MVVEDMDSGSKRTSDDTEEEHQSPYKRKRFDGSEFNLRIIIASKNAGAIIGKKGDNIKNLRKDFNGHILIIDSNGPEKILSINSDIENVCDVFTKIIPCFEDYQEYEDLEFECEIRLLIHQSQAGCIIGHQGARIKELREQTGAGIKLFSECCPMSTDRVVEIKAKPTTVVECIHIIHDYLSKAPPLGPNMPYDPCNYDEFSVNSYGGYTMTEGISGKSGCKGGRFTKGGRGGFSERGMNRRGYDRDFGGMGSSGMGGRGRRDYDMDRMPYGRSQRGRGGYDNFDSPGTGRYDRFSGGRGNSFDFGGRMRGAPERNNSNGYAPYDDFSSNRFGETESSNSTQVSIPQDMAGAIIGPKGANIKQIKMKTGADIFIAEPESGSEERIITIKGTQKQIQAAEYLMQVSVKKSM